MKTTILGKAVTITSSMKMEDIKSLAKFDPETLKKKNDKDDVVYAVGIGTASMSNYGVSFNDANKEGFAQVTLPINCDEKADKAAYVKDTYGSAILNLIEMEEILEERLTAFTVKLDIINDSIKVIE